MLRDGSVGLGALNDGKKPEGLLLNVYKDKVVVKGRNFKRKETVFQSVISSITKSNLKEDKEPPLAPTNLAANYKTDTVIELAWLDSADNYSKQYHNVAIAGYNIYDDDILIGSTNGANYYLVKELGPNTSHIFTVRAKDLAGNLSCPSKELLISTLTSNDAPLNLALGKKATASTTEKGYLADWAVDGDRITKWVSQITNKIEWIMVDLGDSYDISRWVIKNSDGMIQIPSKYPKNYRLMGSNDKISWTLLDAVYENVSEITDRYFNRTSVRYLRVYYDVPSNYNQTASSKERANLYELEVYGANILKQYTPPVFLGELPCKTPKTEQGLNLPRRLPINTSRGRTWAKITWDINTVNYDDSIEEEQRFLVRGNIELPEDVINPDGIPLTTSMLVTVSSDKLAAIQLALESEQFKVGDTVNTSLSGLLANGAKASIPVGLTEYKSSDESIAQIDTSGKIILRKPGSVKINAVISIDGTRVHSNTVTIVVPNNNAELKMIKIDNKKLKEFKTDKFNYKVEMPNNKKEMPQITAKAKHKKAKILIRCPMKMPGTFVIIVTAEDGITTKEYRLNIYKDNKKKRN